MERQESSDLVLWSGRPWILPGVIWRSFLAVIVGVLLTALEIFTMTANYSVAGFYLIYWTLLALLIAWALSLASLVLLSASHRYVLREDSLEIRVGILTSRTSVISPSGFSDLEVIQSFAGEDHRLGDHRHPYPERDPEREAHGKNQAPWEGRRRHKGRDGEATC